MSVPVYVAEAAPVDIRGTLCSIFTVAVGAGILVSGLVAGIFSGDRNSGWRFQTSYCPILWAK